MQSQTELLLPILVILGVSCVLGMLFYFAKIPTVLGFLATGVLIGPSAFAWVESAPGAEAISETALSLLLFTIGLEFNLSRLRSLRRSLLFFGLPQVLFCLVFFLAIFYFFFSFPFSKSIFIGFLLSLSSTAIVLKLVEEARDFNTPYGQHSVGILIFQDLAVLLMIIVTPLLAGNVYDATGFQLGSAAIWLGKAAGAVVGALVLGKYILPKLLSLVVGTRSRELFFFGLLFLGVSCGFLAHALGLSFALGAFVAGVLVAESPFEKQANADFAPLRDVFMAFFFVSIGMLLDPVFLLRNLHWIGLFLLVLFVVKSGVIFSIVRLNRSPKSISIMTALILFQIGEFSFVLARQGVELGILSPMELQYFLCLSIVSLAITPFAYRYGPKLSFEDRFQRWIPDRFTDVFKFENKKSRTQEMKRIIDEKSDLPSFQTLIVGFGIAGQNLASALKSLSIPYKIIEANPHTVERYKKMGEPILFGDATRREILLEAGLGDAKIVVIAVSGVSITGNILDSIRKLRPDIKVVVRTAYVRDVDVIGKYENVEWTVGEIETTLEILSRTLRVYGISSQQIHGFLMQSREAILKDKVDWLDQARRSLELPTWDALSSMRPFKIEEGSLAIHKSLGEINLRKKTNTGVVVVYREEQGTQIPNGDFIFQLHDVLYLLGSEDAMDLAQEYLSSQSDSKSPGSPLGDL